MPKFVKGKPRPPNAGRKPGSPNRATVAVKTAILEALNSGDGATAFFKRLKNSRSAADRHVFAQLCGRLLPRVIEGDLGVDVVDHPPAKVIFHLPHNSRGPLPGETVQAFRARTKAAAEGDGH